MDTAGDPLYGVDGEAPHPPMADLRRDQEQEVDEVEDAYPDTTPELENAQEYLSTRIDLSRDDDNHGIDVYLDAVHLLSVHMPEFSGADDPEDHSGTDEGSSDPGSMDDEER